MQGSQIHPTLDAVTLGQEGREETPAQSVRFRVFQRKRPVLAERWRDRHPGGGPSGSRGGAAKEEAEVKPEVSSSKEKQKAKIKAKGGKRGKKG